VQFEHHYVKLKRNLCFCQWIQFGHLGASARAYDSPSKDRPRLLQYSSSHFKPWRISNFEDGTANCKSKVCSYWIGVLQYLEVFKFTGQFGHFPFSLWLSRWKPSFKVNHFKWLTQLKTVTQKTVTRAATVGRNGVKGLWAGLAHMHWRRGARGSPVLRNRQSQSLSKWGWGGARLNSKAPVRQCSSGTDEGGGVFWESTIGEQRGFGRDRTP